MTHAISAEILQTDTILIPGNQYAAKEITSTSSKEIFSSKYIEQSGSHTVFDFLSQHTAINIHSQYGNTSAPLMDMRGYGSEAGYQNIIINLNGKRLNRLDNAPQIIGNIPLKNIESIEIIRGAGSVRFGDGAMAGVINIITKNTIENSLETSFGTNNIQNNSLNVGFQDELFSILLNASEEKNDGQASADPSGDTNRSKNQFNSLGINITPTEKLKLNLGLMNTRNNYYFPNSLTKSQLISDPSQNGTGKEYTNDDYDIDDVSFQFDYQINSYLKIQGDYFKEEKSLFSQASYGNALQDYDTENFNLVIPYSGENFSITYGVQLIDSQRKDSSGLVTKDNKGYFVDTEIRMTDQLLLNAGTRFEKVDYTYNGSSSLKANESLNAYEIGINYAFNDSFAIFSNFNHAFQAPDVDRFFKGEYPAPAYTLSSRSFNAFIDPAKSNTFNIGFNFKNNKASTLFTTYFSTLKNEIVYNPTTFLNENIDNSEKYGLEFKQIINPTKNISFGLSYNFVKAKIGKNSQGLINGKDMPGVPRQTAVINLRYQFDPQGSISVSHAWRERSYDMGDFANVRGKEQPLYSSTDLAVQYNLKQIGRFKTVALFGSVTNLFEHTNAIAVSGSSFYASNYERVFMGGLKINF